MKTVLLITLFAFALMLAPAVQADTQSWSGWITDEHCGAKGANAEHKSCALKCARDGAALVFYNSADKRIYTLDKQDLAEKHAGHKVVVTGEAEGDAIKVESIEEADGR